MNRLDHVADAQRYGVNNSVCPQCGSNNAMYPMLVKAEKPEMRAMCVHEFHRVFVEFAFRPTLWKFIKYKLGVL